MHLKCDFDEILLKYVDYLLNEQVSYQVINIKLFYFFFFLEFSNNAINKYGQMGKMPVCFLFF